MAERPSIEAMRDAGPELYAALSDVAGAVCSRLCPTTWKTEDGQRHHEACEQIQAALRKARREVDRG